MTLTLPWIILIALAVILSVWILTSNSRSGYLGSDRDFAIAVSIVIMREAYVSFEVMHRTKLDREAKNLEHKSVIDAIRSAAEEKVKNNE